MSFESDVEGFLDILPHSVAEAQRLISAHATSAHDDGTPLAGGDHRIRHCVEVRESSFLDPAFPRLLERRDVATVITNAPDLPVTDAITSDFVYVRLHNGETHYPDGYDDEALDQWAARVGGWLTGEASHDGHPRDVFVYFNSPDQSGTSAPFDAMRLRERLERLRTTT